MSRSLRIALILLAIFVASGASLSRSVPAHADTNAVQFAVYDDIGNIGMYCVTGRNQLGQPVPTHCWTTTGWQTDFYGWWWLNNWVATVDEYNYSGAYQATIWITPQATSNSDSWWCFYANSSQYGGWAC